MLRDLGFVQLSPTIVYEENQSCIAIAKSSVIKSRTKHIKIRYHCAREVQLVCYSTELMIADALTKELAQKKFTAFVNAIMLEDTRLDHSGRLEEHEASRPRFEQKQDPY